MKQATTFIHENGLRQLICDEYCSDDNKEISYSAVFAVPTPTVDNSGIAHVVEHLIFRGSRLFPQPETLFQLTALTPAKINASTDEQITYFHCYSFEKESFALALKFLIHGLFSAKFSVKDLQQEVYYHEHFGVINRELSLLSTNKQYAYQCAINQSLYQSAIQEGFYDEYVGSKASIADISLNDAKLYYRYFYQAKKLFLLTNNVEPTLVSKLLDELPKINPTSLTPYKAKQFIHAYPNDSKNVTEIKQCLRLTIKSSYQAFIKNKLHHIERHLKDHQALLITPSFISDSKQCFNVDIVFEKQDDNTKQRLALILDVLHKLYIDFIKSVSTNPQHNSMFAESDDNRFKKFTPNIKRLMSIFVQRQNPLFDATDAIQQNNTQKAIKPSQANISKTFDLAKYQFFNIFPTLNTLTIPSATPAKAAKNSVVLDRNAIDINTDTVISWLKHYQPLIDHNTKGETLTKTSLPLLLDPLYQNAKKNLHSSEKVIASITDKNHALLLFKCNVSQDDHIVVMIICSLLNAYSYFLAPRCQGHCYTVESIFQPKDNIFTLYSAFDVNSSERINYFYFCLQKLTNDIPYISHVFPTLAKYYNNANTTLCENQANTSLFDNVMSFLQSLNHNVKKYSQFY